MRSMRTSAATFFTRPPCPLSWEARRLAAWHSELGRLLGASHVQLLAQPITVHYQVNDTLVYIFLAHIPCVRVITEDFH